jgi:hypothetical protein
MKFGHLVAISEIWRSLGKLQKNGVKNLAENLRKILKKFYGKFGHSTTISEIWSFG